MPNCSAEKLAAWVKTCFDDSLISQVCPFQSRDICCSRSLDFHIRFQVREKAIPMFEEMGGREGLVHFLDTSLESGLPSAEVMTKNHVLFSFDIAWLFLSRHYEHDYILLAYLLEKDLRIRCGCFNQNHCNVVMGHRVLPNRALLCNPTWCRSVVDAIDLVPTTLIPNLKNQSGEVTRSDKKN
jgi:hypothetical protein